MLVDLKIHIAGTSNLGIGPDIKEKQQNIIINIARLHLTYVRKARSCI